MSVSSRRISGLQAGEDVNPSFNLVDEPWIPCTDRSQKLVHLSIRDLFAQAHDLQFIAHESPIVPVAVIRLLLAIMHRVYGPENAAAWKKLWLQERFDMTALDRYLQQWRHRFDLFDNERPFYQDAAISPKLAAPVSKLIHCSASGNNATLFDHALDNYPAILPEADSALQVITHQVFAVGGLVTPDSNVPRSKYAEGSPQLKCALVMPRAGDLRLTLLLNLRRYAPALGIPFGDESDRPTWEREYSARVGERTPAGWLDLLTWQSRRILLLRQQDGTGVTGIAILKGEQVHENFSLRGRDSMAAWRCMEKVSKTTDPWIPVSFRQDRAVWRDSHCLFASLAGQAVRPPILDWLGDLDSLQGQELFSLFISGLGTDRAKILSWHRESMPLRVVILRQPVLTGQVRRALEHAEAGCNALESGTRRLAELLLSPLEEFTDKKPDTTATGKVAESLSKSAHYWAQLELEFQRFVVDLAAGGIESLEPDTGMTPALRTWIRACRRVAKDAMVLTSRSVGYSQRAFRAIALSEAAFHYKLKRRLPDPEQETEKVSAL
jgi:CRISPR system Cascade subunit CasA